MNDVELALEELRAGRPIVVTDDEGRENEGDLIMPAETATPEQVAFFIRHTSGILCVAIERERARSLNLAPMVAENDAPLATAFTVSVDYREGLTTGISAKERCATVRALANHNIGPNDLVRPGHVFPLVARNGGVLIRSGHTEAAADLARLAGFQPVGLLAELVNDTGDVKKGDDIDAFAREHGLQLISINQLIAYRRSRETLVERVSETMADTVIGPARAIAYQTPYDDYQHLALVFGDIADGENVLVRMQQEDTLSNVFGAERGSLGPSLELIRKEGRGTVIYLRQGAVGVVDSSNRARGGQEEGEDARIRSWQEVGLGAQILRDLGLTSIRVIGTAERQYVGLSGFGVTINETVLLP